MKRSHSHWWPWILAAALLWLLGSLISQLSNVLAPFVTAAVLAYVLNPLACRLERWGLPRALAAGVVTVAGISLIFALILIIAPMLISQGQALAERLPVFVDFLHSRALPWLEANAGLKLELNAAAWRQELTANAGALKKTLASLLPRLSQGGVLLAHFLTVLALLPLLQYYFLLDWNKMTRSLATAVPRRWIGAVSEVALELDRVLGEFLRGQLSVMLIMALVYGGGLALVGLDSGFAIGMVAGLLVFIPYLGAFTGLLLATLAALLQYDGLSGLLLVWGVFAVGQTLESFLVTPYLVGERIGLSPMAVIFALMAFGELMGFVGVLLALPLAAMALVLGRFAARRYFNTRFYQRKMGN
ncbi:AI-2E family transporter [Chromobacterium phragmitis]|uniref:AI-2E family transporter n=1 Tax=Chromobacterium phragmitis TaxID=2202141 RepID=A0A344UGF9_9NEIS|nr:AI-2E family transporter [Chromobacterium phragmitis]AXE28997.1 AI-2E family transporter [Chromobacterium phragmitis]AXE34357.1 AI-2E family transporter [Chromobacterium phragmitis]